MRIILQTAALLGLMLALGPWASAACKSDPKKVILFVDNNASIKEIGAAERAACARGETLIVVPENYKEFGRLQTRVVVLERAIDAPCRHMESRACIAAMRAHQNASDALYDFNSRNQKRTRDALKEELTRQQKAGSRISSLVISGHDGGGSFHGISGSTDRFEIRKLAEEFPKVFENLQSLSLLGCYTAVHSEIRDWKNVFPKLKLVSGYEGAAPLNDKREGHTYVEDMLKREARIIGAANRKQLQNELTRNVRGISELNAAVYVQTDCKVCKSISGNPEYYFRPQKKSGPKLVLFDSKECNEAREQYSEMEDRYEEYYSGDEPIPAQTTGTPLRELYTFLRKNEHCFEDNPGHITAEKTLFLLFFHDVKRSFAKHYSKFAQEVEKILATLTPERLNAQLDQRIQEKEGDVAFFRDAFARLKHDPKAKPDLEAERAALEREVSRLAQDPSIRRCNNLSQMNLQMESPTARERYSQYLELLEKRRKLATILRRWDWDEGTGFLPILQRDVDSLKASKSETLKSLAEAKQKAFAPTLDRIQNKTRAEIRGAIGAFELLTSKNGLGPEQEGVVSDLSHRMNSMLYALECIPFNWHEYHGRPDQPRCIDEEDEEH